MQSRAVYTRLLLLFLCMLVHNNYAQNTHKDYFLNVLDGLENDRSITQIAQVKDRIATMACKAAVKGNMKMSYAEADALICELFTLDNPYNCPHGRPTVISFSETELEKLFKRIV